MSLPPAAPSATTVSRFHAPAGSMSIALIDWASVTASGWLTNNWLVLTTLTVLTIISFRRRHIMQIMPYEKSRIIGLSGGEKLTFLARDESVKTNRRAILLILDYFNYFLFPFYLNHCISCVLTTHSINEYDDDDDITMMFVRLSVRPSVCLGRACIMIIRCKLARISVYLWIVQCSGHPDTKACSPTPYLPGK